LQRRYDHFLREHRARRRGCGLTALENAAEAAHAVTWKALSVLTETKPTTPEEYRALAAHFSSLSDRYAPIWAMREALKHLAA
jgi:hypothetical protein